MALAGKENVRARLALPGKYAEPGQKERPPSSSKIPVLSRSRFLPEQKQLTQECSSAAKNKGLQMPKVSSSSIPAVETASGSLAKSCSREPLGEMHLNASGRRNVLEGGNANGKEASKVEFVPDADALASILSNMGLSNRTVSTTHKPSLARRVPLTGNRACSASSGAGRGSLHVGGAAADPVRVSYLTKSASKDEAHSQFCSLVLNAHQLKALSMTLGNLKPGVEAKHSQPMENRQAGKCKDSAPRSEADCLSSTTEAGNAKQSDSAGGKETTGTSWAGEEFVPDPAAKASILLNVGVSHSALGAGGKLSLARRVPLKDVRKLCVASGSIRGENVSLPGHWVSSSPTTKFGRVSCRSTQGLKGLEELGAIGVRPAVTPGNRCSPVDCSLSGLARRVPATQSRYVHFSPWRCNRELLSSCTIKRSGMRRLAETPQAKWMGESPLPPTGTVSSKKDAHWEKIAVRLFNDDLKASAKKVPAVRVIPSGMGKFQRIEFFARLLQQEINGGIDEVAPSLEELHKLLSVHCSPATETPEPDLVATPPQDTTPERGKTAAPSAPIAPSPEAALTTSSSQPICPAPSLCSLGPSPSSANSAGVGAASSSVTHFKQRLKDLLNASRRFHEDCLNDECAFYTSRATTITHPSVPRCKEPVAKTLDAQDASHFIPISVPQSPLVEADKSFPL